jgi:hypothetical protein
MKKKMFLIGILMASAMFVSAQSQNQSGCVEVRGVETKLVCYEDCESKDTWAPRHGFAFTNNNSYYVSIEAEVYRKRHTCGNDVYTEARMDTKSFDVAPKETYIWKVNMRIEDRYHSECSSLKTYFVTFKAYKCPR